MEIKNAIKFNDLKTSILIDAEDPRYKDLKKINNDQRWTDYINEMLKNKISVRYDYPSDTFMVTPIEVNLRESLGLGIEDIYEDEPTMNVLNLDDVTELFSGILTDTVTQEINSGFEKLKNDLFDRINDTQVNPKNGENLAKIQNYDELVLGEYNYVSAFDNLDIPKHENTELNMGHPDLMRVMGDKFNKITQKSQDEEVDELVVLSTVPQQEEVQEDMLMTVDKEKQINGIPVKLILTGVMITDQEIQYIADEAKKYNLDLTSLQGQGDEINAHFINEHSQKKIVRINDNSFMPFNAEGYNFSRLHECLNYCAKNFQKQEKRMFKEMLTESKKRNTYNIKNYQLNNLGFVNLKNGNNNSVDNVLLTESKNSILGNNVKNTLLVNEQKQYIMVSGTLNGQLKLNQKIFITEKNIKGNQVVGEYQICGFYPNTLQGLGDIMFQTRKTKLEIFG